MAGDTLGMRRLQTPHYKRLLPLKHQIDNLRGILKTKCKYLQLIVTAMPLSMKKHSFVS